MVGLKQEFRQSQQLVMTQQLQQSIKLLQLSSQELQGFLEEELEKNPLLQRDDSNAESAESDQSEQAEISQNEDASFDGSAPAANAEEPSPTPDAFEQAQSNDYTDNLDQPPPQHDNDAGGSYSASAGQGYRGDTDGQGRSLEETLTCEENLRDVLSAQISVTFHDVTQRMLAIGMVDYLDDAGYLREDLAVIAAQFGVETDMVLQTLLQLQKLEPAGIFARDLTECLRLQLSDMNRLDPVMQLMLDNIALMGEGRLAQLQKICEVDAEDFAQILADIKRCNPKPASRYIADAAQIVIPDVIVKRGGHDSWQIELNAESLPRVLVRKEYAAMVGGKADKQAKKYVNEQLANANWLVKALDQRAQTILKVSTEIIKKQDMFLMHGIRFLKPLVLKDIAQAIGMHESTVSRVTNNKFMATPRGTLEMKYFFTSSIGAATGGADFSSKTVMYYIKEAIEGETISKILSDDAIVVILKRRNIDVARRTVAKYREAMHIPSSVIRRRQKRQEDAS
jgi:RNA polymerase sigma-54 factor